MVFVWKSELSFFHNSKIYLLFCFCCICKISGLEIHSSLRDSCLRALCVVFIFLKMPRNFWDQANTTMNVDSLIWVVHWVYSFIVSYLPNSLTASHPDVVWPPWEHLLPTGLSGGKWRFVGAGQEFVLWWEVLFVPWW